MGDNMTLNSTITSLFAVSVVVSAAACAHFPSYSQTIPVPAPAQNRDVLEIAIDVAKSVGLPPATKVDRANKVVEFGAFGRSVTGYTAQVRVRSDGQLDVTVTRGSVYISQGVEGKAKEFVSALQTRLNQVT